MTACDGDKIDVALNINLASLSFDFFSLFFIDKRHHPM